MCVLTHAGAIFEKFGWEGAKLVERRAFFFNYMYLPIEGRSSHLTDMLHDTLMISMLWIPHLQWTSWPLHDHLPNYDILFDNSAPLKFHCPLTPPTFAFLLPFQTKLKRVAFCHLFAFARYATAYLRFFFISPSTSHCRHLNLIFVFLWQTIFFNKINFFYKRS